MLLWIVTLALTVAPRPAVARAAPLEIGGATIDVVFSPFPHSASESEVHDFVLRSAEPVAAYYGRFPVSKLRLEVVKNDRGTGLFGKEFHGNRVRFFLGPSATAAQMHESGILTHEMFHLGFPDLDRKYAWIEEGLATYLAHLARARAKQTTETEFWSDMRDGFTDALPKKGDGGLGTAESYRRIYWGGALFWFEIDLEVREYSHGTKSLDSVTRAILASGGNNAHPWKLAHLRRAVDRHAGFPVFKKWYDALGMKPGTVDLPALWARLGLAVKGEHLEPTGPNDLREALLKNLPTLAK